MQEKQQMQVVRWFWKNHGILARANLKSSTAASRVYQFEDSLTRDRLVHLARIRQAANCLSSRFRTGSPRAGAPACTCSFHRFSQSAGSSASLQCWVVKWFFITKKTYLWGFPVHIVQEYNRKVKTLGIVWGQPLEADSLGVPLPPKHKPPRNLVTSLAFDKSLSIVKHYFQNMKVSGAIPETTGLVHAKKAVEKRKKKRSKITKVWNNDQKDKPQRLSPQQKKKTKKRR